MWQSTSLTLGIMKSLYPRANLDAAGEGFAMTVIARQVIDMLGVEMSLG
jgi:hypothetical protein